MKSAFAFTMISLLSVSSFAATKTVRCAGLNSANVQIGMDVELDGADRIQSLTSFVADSTGMLEIEELGAPSHFVRIDGSGKLLLFGFKTFNKSFGEEISMTFVDGQPGASVLKIGSGAQNIAVKNIACGLLK